MRRRRLSACLVAPLVATCGGNGGPGLLNGTESGLVATQAPLGLSRPSDPLDLDGRYPTGSRIVLLSPDGDPARTRVLSPGLSAAGGPTVAPDGRRVAFTGRRTPESPFAVHLVAPGQPSPIPVLESEGNCGPPAFLAGGRIVAACADAALGVSSLWVVLPHGPPPARITFAGAAADPRPLPDGRILFRMRRGGWAPFVVNPDGTGLDAGPALAPPEPDDGEAVPLSPSPPPRGRPSSLRPDAAPTGRLLCHDATRSDGVAGPPPGAGRPVRVTVSALADEPLGSAPIEPDGSFFVEVPADVPVRLRTLDGQGKELAACAPIWVRPGEVRACWGCHEGRAAAPVNRALLAVRRAAHDLSSGATGSR